MVKEIDKLSAEDRAILLKAPALVSVLVASGDHEISNSEKQMQLKWLT